MEQARRPALEDHVHWSELASIPVSSGIDSSRSGPGVDTSPVADFIGYPRGKVLAVFDRPADADAAVVALRGLPVSQASIERFEGRADADRFDATGERHGPVERVLRAVQFSMMDQLPAMAWYEAALREGKVVIAVRTRDRAGTTRVVEALAGAGGHYINHFGRAATEQFTRWRGPEPAVASLMKH